MPKFNRQIASIEGYPETFNTTYILYVTMGNTTTYRCRALV